MRIMRLFFQNQLVQAKLALPKYSIFKTRKKIQFIINKYWLFENGKKYSNLDSLSIEKLAWTKEYELTSYFLKKGG